MNSLASPTAGSNATPLHGDNMETTQMGGTANICNGLFTTICAKTHGDFRDMALSPCSHATSEYGHRDRYLKYSSPLR